MHSRRPLVALIAVATVVLGTATTANAASTHPVAAWEMNESPGARTMVDSSGHGLSGTIGREVGTGTRVDGEVGYRFGRLTPDTPPTHPGHLATVDDDSQLDPGTRDYAVTVRLRTTEKFGNIVQKGQATVDGGSFKLQIPSGIVQCLFRGSSRQLLVSAHHAINDGRWHTVRCERTADEVALYVDGSLEAYRYGRTGRIANSWPVSIGGKTDCDQIDVGCDYFAGDLDYVEIDAGR